MFMDFFYILTQHFLQNIFQKLIFSKLPIVSYSYYLKIIIYSNSIFYANYI